MAPTRIVFHRPVLSIVAVVALAIGVAAQSKPNPPTNLVVVSVTGGTVVLQWQPTSVVQGYVVEAGSSPGASNIGRFFTGSAAPTIVGTSVAAGTYYVRVRGVSNGVESDPSNEITLTVGSVCTAVPGAPGQLTSSVSGSSVQLSWGASSGQVSTYVFEIGSTSGASDLGTIELGSTATSYLASGVAPGRYFVRVKARNACGLSAASNDTTIVVGGGAPPPPSGPARLQIINAQASTILGGPSAGQSILAGEVINTGGTTASFVTVSAEVFSTTGSRLRGVLVELNGRSRRLQDGRVENWTLGPGETGCFSLPLGQASTIGRYDVRLEFETLPTTPLQGQLQAAVTWSPDFFDPTIRLRISPSMTNVGSTPTAWNRVAFVIKDSGGRALGCGATAVYGRTNANVPGYGVTNVILPGETGFTLTGNPVVTTSVNVPSVATVTAWPQWKE